MSDSGRPVNWCNTHNREEPCLSCKLERNSRALSALLTDLEGKAAEWEATRYTQGDSAGEVAREYAAELRALLEKYRG